jgi:hypothetical protein
MGGSLNRKDAYTAAVVVAFALFCMFLLSANGVTFISATLHDTFIMLDGGYRIMSGQVPHVDFHSPLGALAYLLPAATLIFSDSYGLLSPVLSGICLFIFLPVLLYVTLNRFRPTITIAVSVYLLLIIILPMNLGDYKHFSIAIFYNRFGWVALAILFMFYMPGGKRGRLTLLVDGFIMGLLLVLMLYMKISYFLVGLVFVFLLLIFRPEIRTSSLTALGLTLASVLAVELAYNINAGYMRDIYMGIKVNSAIRGNIAALSLLGPFNIVGLVCLFALAALNRDLKGLAPADYLYYLYTSLSSLMIINQNAQAVELVSLVGPLAVAAEGVIRSKEQQGAGRALSIAALAFLALFMAREASVRSVSMAYYFLETSRYEEREDMPAVLRGMHIREGKKGNALKAHIERRHDWPDAFNHSRRPIPLHALFQEEYLMTVLDGAVWLEELGERELRVSVLDFTNPFSLIMGMPPPSGQNNWNHKGRNFNRWNYIAPEEAYGDTDLIMYPSYPVTLTTRDLLMELYGGYFEDNFALVGETSMWRIYRRKGN